MTKIESGEKSGEIIVEGDTLEAALSEAASILGCDKKRVRYSIIEKGSRRFFGLGFRPFKIRARKSDPAASRVAAALKAVEDLDGHFRISQEGTEVMVTVYPPLGLGKRVSREEIISSLDLMGVDGLDRGAIERAAEEASTRPVRVGVLRFLEERNAHVKVRVEEDGLSAYAILVPPQRGGSDISAEEFMVQVRRAGVVFGLIHENMAELANRRIYNEPTIIARGEPAMDGEDGRIEYNFRTDLHKVSFEEDDSGRVDFRELGLVENVSEDQVLAVLVPPTRGKPGREVTGKIIAARDGVEIPPPRGENIVPDRERIKSAITGHVELVDGRISVMPVFQVEGDLDYSVGNIDFDGSVRVKGLVEDNFTIKARGGVYVEKSIGKSHVDSGGNVVVLGGIIGKGEGRVRASGDIVARFAEQADLVAGGDVIVGEMISHSRVVSAGDVILDGRRARLVGGEIIASGSLHVRDIGGEGTTRTIVKLGLDPSAMMRIEGLRSALAEDEEKRSGIVEALAVLREGRTDDPAAVARLPGLERSLAALDEKIGSIREELRVLERNIEVSDMRSVVKISGTAMEGTQIQIGRKKIVLRRPASYCGFRRISGKIEMVPF